MFKVTTRNTVAVCKRIESTTGERPVITPTLHGTNDIVFTLRAYNLLVARNVIEFDVHSRSDVMYVSENQVLAVTEQQDPIRDVDFTKKKNNYLLRSKKRDVLTAIMVAAEAGQVKYTSRGGYEVHNSFGAWRATVDAQAKDLERRGLVESMRMSNRGWSWRIRLTPEGQACLNAVTPDRGAILDHINRTGMC